MPLLYAILAVALIIIGILIDRKVLPGPRSDGHGPIDGFVYDLGKPVMWAVIVAIAVFLVAMIIRHWKKGEAKEDEKE
ncbi:MAG TPA: hypothetical protein DET40_04695 [Lentisphaeria bacterium]|nr:MAG: hypothetical protein A2X45_21430 [Lentisphaerae bacterium GWF2_50_93]HCE42823.1 hypothetical protein [Lentisphaeria bacterium]